MDWAEVRTMEAEGVSRRQIAMRLGIDARTVRRLAEADEPPSYQRAPAGSMLDPLEPVVAKLIAEWPEIKSPRVAEILRDEHGYEGSVDLVRKRIAKLRPPSERPAQRTGYRPAQVMQIDWGEMPTRPKILGKERRIYALVCSLPYSGASTAHFSFDMTIESFLEGHVHAFGRRSSRVPLDGYLKHRGSFYRAPEALVHRRVELRFDRDRVWITHRGETVAAYERSYRPGTWQPAPVMRPEPPPPIEGSRRRRSHRPGSPTTRSSARERRRRDPGRAAALPDLKAEGAADRRAAG